MTPDGHRDRRSAIPEPFPSDGTALQKVDWIWAYGPMIFVQGVATLTAVAILWLWQKVKGDRRQT